MSLPPVKVLDSAGNTIDAATFKLKVPFNTAIKSGTQVELLQPSNKNRLTVPNLGVLGSVTGITFGSYAVVVLGDATNDWMTSQSSGIEPDLGQRVRVVSSGSVPSGLTAGTDYYVVANVKQSGSGGIKVSATQGGSAIDLTTAGTGTITLFPCDRPFSTSSTRPTPGRTTIATNSSSPVSGTADLVITSTSAVPGDYVAFPFTIDSSERGQTLNVDFKYLLANTTADQTITVWVNDLTNNQLIPVTPYVCNFSTLAQEFSGSFQASSNSTSYELMIVRATISSTNLYTDAVHINEISVSRNRTVRGAVITDPVLYTPTFTGLGTVVSPSVYYQKIGPNLRIFGNATTGTSSGTTVKLSLPSGIAHSSANNEVVGKVLRNNTGATDPFQGVILSTDTTNVYITRMTTTPFAATAGTTLFGNGEYFSFDFTITPIAGWASNQISSSDAVTRVCVARAGGNPASASAANPIIFPTVLNDTHGAYSGSTGKFTAPIAGYFKISGYLLTPTAATTINAYIDGIDTTYSVGQTDSNGKTALSGLFFLNAGQTLDIRPSGTLDVATGSALNFEQVTGPSQIFPADTVSAGYFVSANFTGSTSTPFNFDSKDWDSHNAVTPSASAWKFAAPMSGLYEIGGMLKNNAGLGVGMELVIYKNGVAVKSIGHWDNSFIVINPNVTIRLLTGDTIDIRTSTSTATMTGGTLSTAGTSYISITRVGNY